MLMLNNSLRTPALVLAATVLFASRRHSLRPLRARCRIPTDVQYPWAVEFGIGWDNSISGNINSSGIGRINNQPVVILKNCYEDVYGPACT